MLLMQKDLDAAMDSPLLSITAQIPLGAHPQKPRTSGCRVVALSGTQRCLLSP